LDSDGGSSHHCARAASTASCCPLAALRIGEDSHEAIKAMGFRITTWNVNGIRNPFGYQPWRGSRTFEGMFDILESDIVIMQELKIQRKDLRDDMVLVPGWDCYFSLPRHKKGRLT